MDDTLLNSALEYMDRGFSVIPLKKNKRCFLPKWKPFQTKAATEEQIREWWRQHPDANIGIVTGKISGITAIDADSEIGRDAVNEFLPESLTVPIAKTPDGYAHYLFKYTEGILTRSKHGLADCDTRNDGGYIVAVPSVTDYIEEGRRKGGRYEWFEGLSIDEVSPPPMPGMLADVLRNGERASSEHPRAYKIDNIHLGKKGGAGPPADNKATTNDNNDNIFTKGRRDNDLFNLANDLVKAGMPVDKITKYLLFCAAHCCPPFPEKEAEAKIASALNRNENREKSLTDEIRDVIMTTSDNITTTFVYQVTTLTTRQDRKKALVILGRFVKEGLLERVPGQNGVYRRVERECDAIDYKNATTSSVDMWLPFGLHDMVEILPGNIIVVAGSPNAGKTALLLNIVRQNMKKFHVHYFNSEMGANELRKRLEKFDDLFLDGWCFHPWERSENFADVIKPGEGNINIIDYLEIYENFYEISGKIAAIHKKLQGAVGIIAIQKNPNTDAGLGGFRTLEKPRLALSLNSGTLKIVKAKNWKCAENPNGKGCVFNIIDGSKLYLKSDWHPMDLKFCVQKSEKVA